MRMLRRYPCRSLAVAALLVALAVFAVPALAAHKTRTIPVGDFYLVKELSQVVEDLTQRPHLRLQLRRLDPVQLAPHGAVAAHERAAVGRDLGERQVVADRAQQFLDVVLAVQTLPGETAESLQVIRERSLWRRRHLRPYETFRDRHTETVGTADPAVKRVCLDGVMEMVELGPLTAEQKAELEGDELDPFGAAGVTLRYRPKERHFALADDDGRLAASAGTVVVDVEVDAERFPVVGIGGVIVRAPYRGRGLARRVVEAALDAA